MSHISSAQMNAEPLTSPVAPAPFVKPSPGTWAFDASHCERPLPRIMWRILEEAFTKGNREGIASYGLLVDTIEMQLVNGFIYTCVRPLGAPPEPKSHPPRFVFRILCSVHPGIRRRVRLSDEALRARLWRQETANYLEQASKIEARLQSLLTVDVSALDDTDLAAHAKKCWTLAADDAYVHYRVNISRILPVGDLLAHVARWTDVETSQVLQALRGTSPNSEEGLPELHALAELLRDDSQRIAAMRVSEDAQSVVDDLQAETGEIGRAARAWMNRIGHRTSGFSVGYPTLQEMPATLVQTLLAAVDNPWISNAGVSGEEAARRLRDRIPPEHLEEFDALMEEARSVYFLRDHCTQRNTATFGVLRLAALEIGRRLVERGALDVAEAALDLRIEDVSDALDGASVDLKEVHRWFQWRMSASSDEAPELLGPEPIEPPPTEWLPAGANRRMTYAIESYSEAMMGEVESTDVEKSMEVRGMAASPGKRRGRACLVLKPGDFDRVRPGDVLIARMTAPSYNILLPMLAGVVTDRGGILSHPAIVSREFGIPGVVGTRTATATIPDGAMVEIDGDTGVVRVLS